MSYSIKILSEKNIFIFIARRFEKKAKNASTRILSNKSNRMFVFKGHLTASIIVAITSVDKHNNITYYHCRYCQALPRVVKMN